MVRVPPPTPRRRPLRPRRPLARSRLPLHRRVVADPGALRRWVLVAALATTSAVLVAQVVGRADAARRSWGRTAPVLVVHDRTDRGDPLDGAVTTEGWPIALVPPGAVGRLPPGAVAAVDLEPGLPLTSVLVARPDDDGDGRRRVALPLGEAAPPLEPGDRVEVWATVDPTLAGAGPTTRRVAASAEVVASERGSVVVAVEAAVVADVAEAAALATVTVVGVGA